MKRRNFSREEEIGARDGRAVILVIADDQGGDCALRHRDGILPRRQVDLLSLPFPCVRIPFGRKGIDEQRTVDFPFQRERDFAPVKGRRQKIDRKRGIVQDMLEKKPHRRRTGLRALYFSYLYKVGALPKKPRYISYAVREDIRKLDRRIEQAEFIFKNHIADRGQLAAIRQKAEDEIAVLIKQRQKLYRYEPKSPQIGVCTAQLKKLRHTVKLCRNIEIHSIEMEQRLQSARLEEQQKKEDPQKEARNRDNQKGR